MLGFIKKHWNGEYSLTISYWLNTVALGIAISVVSTIIGLTAKDTLNLHLMLAIAVAAIIVTIAITLWQVTGTWRSASNHKLNTGRKFWATAAQVMMIVAIVQTTLVVKNTTLATIEIGNILWGDDDLSEYAIEVTEDGKIEITGYITFPLVKEFEQLTTAHPRVKTVAINSPGGRLAPARYIRDLIQSKNLDTLAQGRCESACTLIFMSGRQRIVAPGTLIGFHQYSLPGISRSEMRQEERQDQRYFRTRNVPQSFLDKAFSAPHEEIWLPTLQELLAANVVTHVRVGSRIVDLSAYCDQNDCTSKSSSPIWLQETAARINQQTPKRVDEITILERTVAGPGNTFTYLHAITAGQTINFDIVDAHIEKRSCVDPGLRVFIDRDVKLRFIYRGSVNKKRHEKTMTSADCERKSDVEKATSK